MGHTGRIPTGVTGLRLTTFNLNGAFHGGRSTPDQQQRAWHHLAALGTCLGLIQEVGHDHIPAWVPERWDLLLGEIGTCDKSYRWGSAIVADPALNLRPRPDLLEDPWLCMLYDYVVAGEIDLPDGETALVASAHTVASTAADFLGAADGIPGVIDTGDLARIAQPGDDAWVLDIAFEALRRNTPDRFIIGGDWNTSRLFDAKDRDGNITNTLFFSRAAKAGWWECAAGTNDERTFLRPGTHPYQLDHLFCDPTTGTTMTTCGAARHPLIDDVSDHAPLVADFEFP